MKRPNLFLAMTMVLLAYVITTAAQAVDEQQSVLTVIKSQQQAAQNSIEEKYPGKIVIYPEILILQAADFVAFNHYMAENREQYRKRRSDELVTQSQGFYGTNPELVELMIKAYEKFDDDYSEFKTASKAGIGKELASQLMAALDRLKDKYLMSDQESKIIFTYGEKSLTNLQNLLNVNKTNIYEEKQPDAHDIAKIANTFLYGYWSYYDDKNIKIIMHIEPVGGKVKTLEATGSAQGQAMEKMAELVFDHIQAMKNYETIINPQPHLVIKRPISMDDKKTHTEAQNFCQSQNLGLSNDEAFRLPYARELLNMPGKYFEGGAVFLNFEDNSYAVADTMGGFSQYKIVSQKEAQGQNRLQKAEPNEMLSYFCVKGEAKQTALSIDELYKELNSKFAEVKKLTNNNITSTACQDANDTLGVKAIKDISIQIKKLSPQNKIRSVIKKCVINYLQNRFKLQEELYLIEQN